jgi:hypothetical protein
MNNFSLGYRLFYFFISIFVTANFPILVVGQSNIEFQVEGKQFINKETGLIFQYGYIGQWNTSGITITNKNGVKFYYINCSKNISSDGNSMILTQCRSLNDEGAGTVYVYLNRVIQSYPDGKFVFEPVKSSDGLNGPSGLDQLILTEGKKHGLGTEYSREAFNQVYDKDVWRKRKNDFANKVRNFGDVSRSQEKQLSDIFEWYDIYIEKAKPGLSDIKAAENNSKNLVPIDNKIYSTVDVPAEYPGGPGNFDKLKIKTIERYIDELYVDGRSGSVAFQFVVNIDGSITDFKEIPCNEAGGTDCLPLNSTLAKIMTKAIKEGPKWEPATLKGKAVNSLLKKRISFKIG